MFRPLQVVAPSFTPVIACVVAIPASLAGADRHSATASAALGKAGEEGRTVHDPWRRPRRPSGCQPAPDRLKGLRLYDLGCRDFDPLAAVFCAPRARVLAIEVVAPDISLATEDLVNKAGGEPAAVPIRQTLEVELRRNSAEAFVLAT